MIAVNIIAVRAQTGKFLVEHHRSLNVRYEFPLVERRIGRQKYENPLIYDQRRPGLKQAGKNRKSSQPRAP
jgi:hypothetical protein